MKFFKIQAFSLSVLLVGIIRPDLSSASNPLIRTCTINSGIFEVYTTSEPAGHDLALCRWNKVVVDALSLVSSLEGHRSIAAALVLDDVVGASNCQTLSGTNSTLPTGEVLCTFADKSLLSLETIQSDLASPDRAHLKEVLSSR